MLGIDRRAAKYTWTAFLLVLLIWLVYMVRSTLLVFILAVLFAYLLSPLVNLLDRFLPTSKTRTLAMALSYVIFLGLAVFIGIEIGTRVVEQATAFTQGPEPKAVEAWLKTAPPAIQAEVTKHTNELLAELPQIGLKFLGVASNLIFVVIIPILSFFFLKDGHLIRAHILELVEEGPRRALLDDIMADIHLLLAHYMRVLVLLSLATFTGYSIFFSIMGVPYGILLAVLAAALEFIPTMGPLAAGIIVVTVAAVSGSHWLVVLIFIVAYRFFQDYVLSPHLMGQGVELHPLLVLFGVFAGAELAGIPGTFLSVPVLALARVLYLRFRMVRLGLQSTPIATVRS